jgi:DNA-binding CsgD family transcriptional regulator
MATLTSTAARGRRELIAQAGEADDVRELFGAASRRLRRLVPFDAAVWLVTDPATCLPTAPTRSENMEHRCRLSADDCVRVWEHEFLLEDENLFSDLARQDMPAAGLRLATGDRPGRSARYREVMRPKGFGDELRAVLRADGSPWASITLFRDEGRPPFDAAETELVASLSRPLGEAVRDHAKPVVPGAVQSDARGPGLILFARTGELISVNDDALAWLEELPGDFGERTDLAASMPIFVVATLMRARAIAEERERGIARARMRSRSGRWLVCHASCLRDHNGEIGDTALVIEPARASEIAPLVAQALELSPREQQITELISLGLGTAEIASRLYLSVHTVRDYVKAIFEKVGVSSRGELVAKLFAEHYAPIHLDPSGLELVGE